jgi:hypothetical protein
MNTHCVASRTSWYRSLFTVRQSNSTLRAPKIIIPEFYDVRSCRTRRSQVEEKADPDCTGGRGNPGPEDIIPLPPNDRWACCVMRDCSTMTTLSTASASCGSSRRQPQEIASRGMTSWSSTYDILWKHVAESNHASAVQCSAVQFQVAGECVKKESTRASASDPSSLLCSASSLVLPISHETDYVCLRASRGRIGGSGTRKYSRLLIPLSGAAGSVTG